MLFADQLARLRVATETGRLPANLGRWAIAELEARASRTERLELRDALLRQAGDLVGGPSWTRARALAAELADLHRRRPPLSPLRQLLAAAVEIDPATPRSERQIYRVLEH